MAASIRYPLPEIDIPSCPEDLTAREAAWDDDIPILPEPSRTPRPAIVMCSRIYHRGHIRLVLATAGIAAIGWAALVLGGVE